MALVGDRWEIICPLVKGRSVLDVGCAELAGSLEKPQWLHNKIITMASRAVGLDVNEVQVNLLRKKGYEIVLGNCETINLNEKYDVIFAGELIEHLSNPGLFFDNMKRHLAENGLLILTTPNRFNGILAVSCIIRNKIPTYNKPMNVHVHFYDGNSLKALAERHGYREIETHYYTGGYEGLRGNIIARLFHKLRPRFAIGIIMVLKTRDE